MIPIPSITASGRALCVLEKEDFLERVPNVGDVLFRDLHMTKQSKSHSNQLIPLKTIN